MDFKIYVSYAWKNALDGDGHREVVVDELQQLIQKKGLKLIRDKNDLHYGHSIRQFMQDIGAGDFILIVLSEKYLTSEYCMYEVMEIMRRRDYLKHLLPVILPDANIFERKINKKYLSYWIEKYEVLKKDIQDLGDYVPKKYFEDRDFYELIIRNFDDFVRSVADINSSTPALLRENNYAQILEIIENRAAIKAESVSGAFSTQKNTHLPMDNTKWDKIIVDGNGNIILNHVSGEQVVVNYNDTEKMTELVRSISQEQMTELKSMLGKEFKHILTEIGHIQLENDKYRVEHIAKDLKNEVDDFLAEMKKHEIEHKKALLLTHYKLLRENEYLLALEDEPRKMQRFQFEIDRIKRDIEQYTAELRKLIS